MSSQQIIKKVLVLGSGGLRIGQAGEFDYSGSQALKALRQEDIFTILVNPNIATVQTDPGMADTLYLEPITLERVSAIIKKERPDGILLGFGGQTALNVGLELHRKGILKQYGVAVLGTPIKAIEITEDRDLFKKVLQKIKVKTPRSLPATTVARALAAAKQIGYPVMMRAGFSLGGLGSGKIENEASLKIRASEALHGSPQILIEEYLAGWKELEYEIVRDANDTTIVVCNMENFDPMGVHTGESIVVAPSQTLNNQEYHLLRELAIRVTKAIGIVGECNIQFALDPKTGDYRVIEMNARLSRSSALASKATGYPLAYVAAKLALGKRLTEIKNSVTKRTTACFEPALDYIVVKIPRWDITKFKNADRTIGTEMKSVGEVMAIGRSFPEAIQKAVRMLNINVGGLSDYSVPIPDQLYEIEHPTDRRLFAIYQALRHGTGIATIHKLSGIDLWFLNHLAEIVQVERSLNVKTLTVELLLGAKKYGFSDKTIAALTRSTEEKIRKKRREKNIVPIIKQIDTLAGEFDAETNYLYTTYHGTKHDVKPSSKRPLIIIGSGPYCIGSSVEFDWSAVNTARTARSLKETAIIINSNPETVSTDYDESDRLYFEELTLERVRDIADFEKSKALVVSVGGQIANNLSKPLADRGYKLLGTAAHDIDRAENRHKFSKLLSDLGVDQPAWQEVTTFVSAKNFAAQVGYPLIIRPSYILSGTAMNVVYSEADLEKYLAEATIVSREYPVVISQFITNAKEIEMDGVASNGKVVIQAIAEHIENAGVHSGDATIVLPPQRLYLETIRRTKLITEKIVRALNITGPFNIQFLAKHNDIKVIECNVRASRSFPFVSKVTNHNLIDIAARVMLGKPMNKHDYETLELNYVAVKSPQFSYQRIKGADPVGGVEMASTGEVACFGHDYTQAFFSSWLATEQKIRGKNILLAIGSDKKSKLLESIKKLDAAGWNIFATSGTHDFLTQNGVAASFLYKGSQVREPNALSAISNQEIDLIVNIPNGSQPLTASSDGFHIRRLAINHHIPLITDFQLAELFLSCLTAQPTSPIEPVSWQEYTHL